MDAQELRNLQEAYLEVVENQQLDEANRGDEHVTSSMYMSREPETRAAKVRRRQIRDGLPNNASHQGDDKDYDRQVSHQVSRGRKKLKAQSYETLEGNNKDKNTAGKYAGMQRRKRQGLSYKEQVDIYDLILSHLLDEGYAETPEAAEAIMVSMSEEWRQSIVEETIVSVEGGGKRKYTQSKDDMKADAQSAKERSDAAEHRRKRKSEMDAGRLTVATKRGIEKATNRSERTTGYVPNSRLHPHERDDSFANRNARRRRASGR